MAASKDLVMARQGEAVEVHTDAAMTNANDDKDHDGNETAFRFTDLPREVRDQIHLRHNNVAWIDLTAAPDTATQPTISKVNKQTRTESLDVFYGKNKFMVDLRGLKHSSVIPSLTPLQIFERWVTAIGDENAARLRHLIFYSKRFTVHIKIHAEKPQLSMKFRAVLTQIELDDDDTAGYNLKVAAKRATARLHIILNQIQDSKKGSPLCVADVLQIGRSVAMLLPFFCKYGGLGSNSAVLPSDDTAALPDTREHVDGCEKSECSTSRPKKE